MGFALISILLFLGVGAFFEIQKPPERHTRVRARYRRLLATHKSLQREHYLLGLDADDAEAAQLQARFAEERVRAKVQELHDTILRQRDELQKAAGVHNDMAIAQRRILDLTADLTELRTLLDQRVHAAQKPRLQQSTRLESLPFVPMTRFLEATRKKKL